MTRQQSFRQANAFAMLDGLWFGLYWCFGFLCVIKGMGSSTLGSLGTMVTLSVPVLGCFFARKFERQVREDAPVGFGKAYLYGFLLYFYASLILAIFAFVYFNWFDHGVFAQNYIAPTAHSLPLYILWHDILQAKGCLSRQSPICPL